jgi:hypothetical protein
MVNAITIMIMIYYVLYKRNGICIKHIYVMIGNIAWIEGESMDEQSDG